MCLVCARVVCVQNNVCTVCAHSTRKFVLQTPPHGWLAQNQSVASERHLSFEHVILFFLGMCTSQWTQKNWARVAHSCHHVFVCPVVNVEVPAFSRTCWLSSPNTSPYEPGLAAVDARKVRRT
jgi:uncharacterized membrane protein (UPF0182 family)